MIPMINVLGVALVVATVGAAPAVALANPVEATQAVQWLTQNQMAALQYLADQKAQGNPTVQTDFLVAQGVVPDLLLAEFHGLIAGGYIRYTAPPGHAGFPDLITITTAGVIRSHQPNP